MKEKEKNPQHALDSRSLFFPGLLKFLFQGIFLTVFSGFTCQRSHYHSSTECPLLASAEKRGKMGNSPLYEAPLQVWLSSPLCPLLFIFQYPQVPFAFCPKFSVKWERLLRAYPIWLHLKSKAALFLRDPKWKQPNCPSMLEWTNCDIFMRWHMTITNLQWHQQHNWFSHYFCLVPTSERKPVFSLRSN